MKFLNMKFWFIASLLFLVACNSDYESSFGFPDFVQWSKPTDNIDENSDEPLTVIVQLVGPQRNQEVNLEIEIVESNLVEGVDYEFPNGKELVIPANESTAEITILPIDNDEISEQLRTITLKIIDASGGLKIDAGSQSIVVAINEDDFWCPRNQLSNAISTETDLGYSTTNVSIEKSITPDGCLRIDILGGGSSMFGVTDIKYSGVILVESSPESITGTVVNATFQFTTLNGELTYRSAGQVINMVISNGTYNLETGVLQFDYQMLRGTAPWFPGTLIYE